MIRSVLVAFSGGIDSCAAVDILRSEGWHVECATIDMMGDEAMLSEARQRAAALGVTHHTIDGRELFKREIIDNFTNEYLAGHTPAPCTRCNPLIKWNLIAREADRLGISHIATGHYINTREVNGRCYVTRGDDPNKDQSYYLWGVASDVIKRAVTPMGRRIKSEVKAAEAAASGKTRGESMGVCFLAGRHYTEFIAQHCGEAALSEGDITNLKGETVGRHNGIARYTIGQKRGEGIPSGLRVVAIDSKMNRVIVGDNSELLSRKLVIEKCHFIDPDEVNSATNITVMIRGIGRNPSGYCQVEYDRNERRATILLEDDAWAAAIGQPIVLYIEDRVVGGGWLATAN